MNENKSLDDFKIGWFLHLVTDYLFFEECFTEEYLLNTSYNDFCRDLYFAYDHLNLYLTQKYHISKDDYKDYPSEYYQGLPYEKCILSIKKVYNVADDWSLYKGLGIKLKAVKPYLIDANVNMDLLGSDVLQEQWGINRKLMSCKNVLESYITALIKRGLSGIGHFESKIRVINNKVVF